MLCEFPVSQSFPFSPPKAQIQPHLHGFLLQLSLQQLCFLILLYSSTLHSHALTEHKTLQDLHIPPSSVFSHIYHLVSPFPQQQLLAVFLDICLYKMHQAMQQKGTDACCITYIPRFFLFHLSGCPENTSITGQRGGKDTEMHAHTGSSLRAAVLQHEICPSGYLRGGCDLHGVRLWR